MAVGRVLRFDEVRGYGFIAPSGGGEDVFVHANDFGEFRHLVHPGMNVEFESEHGERGLKVRSVRILSTAAPAKASRSFSSLPPELREHAEPGDDATGEDDGLCDVLMPREFTAEVTEILIQRVPSLTGDQIAQIRQHLVEHARSHGWVES